MANNVYDSFNSVDDYPWFGGAYAYPSVTSPITLTCPYYVLLTYIVHLHTGAMHFIRQLSYRGDKLNREVA